MDGDHDVKDIFKMERDAGGGCSTPQLSKEAIMGTGKVIYSNWVGEIGGY